jgi:transposase
MLKSTRRHARAQGTSRHNLNLRRPAYGPARQAAPELSRRARARLDMLDWHDRHGRNLARTARHHGFSRPTLYRWLGRFERDRLETLEDRSSRPLRRRRPTWTIAQLEAVRTVRETYPRWGKDKLVVLLRRSGIRLSVSMVGRILARLRRSGELPEPTRRRMGVHRRRWTRPYAIRKPAGWTVERPGDLVQIDTLEIRPLSTLALKQFTARDVVSRWDVLELGRRATAPMAAAALDAVRARMPFPIRAISIEGGSEFIPRVRGDLSGPRHRPVRPAAALAQAAWRRRAGQPDPHRGVLRGHRCAGRARRPGRRYRTDGHGVHIGSTRREEDR